MDETEARFIIDRLESVLYQISAERIEELSARNRATFLGLLELIKQSILRA